MANEKKIEFLIIVLSFIFLGASCAKRQHEYSQETMISLAEELGTLFEEQELRSVQSRNNYYIFELKNASYIITHDCMVIRDADMGIVSDDAKEDALLADSLKNFLKIVQDLNEYNICYVFVSHDTIKLSTADGYFLTNKVPTCENNALERIQENWYSNR